MHADAIAKKLAAGPKSDGEFHQLILAIGERRAEINLQLSGDLGTKSAARRAAELLGLAAVRNLEDSAKALQAELGYLDQLEQRIVDDREAAAVSRLKADIPRAVRELPKASAKVAAALAELDAALAAHRSIAETVAGYADAKLPYPFADAQLAAELQLREALWKPRTIAAILPPGSPAENLGRFPTSFRFAWSWNWAGEVAVRRFPQYVPPLDSDPSEIFGEYGAAAEKSFRVA